MFEATPTTDSGAGMPTLTGMPLAFQDKNGGQKATDGELRLDAAEAIRCLKEDSKRARLPREEEWNKNWNLYNNYYNFRAKAEWQSKVPLSRVNTSVRLAAKLMKKGLIGNRDFFSTKGYGETGKLLAPHIQKITKYHLDAGNFPSRYYTALVSGMLSTPIIMKIYPKMVEMDEPEYMSNKGYPAINMKPPRNTIGEILGSGGRKKKILRVCFDPCSAFDVYFDPYGNNMYLIHTIDMDLHVFRDMVLSPEGKASGWNPDVLNMVESEYTKYEEEVAEATRKGQNVVHSSVDYRRRIRLDEFYGTLVSQKGEVMFRDCYAVLVNEKYMGVRPRPIEFPRKRWPFAHAPIIEKPFSTWHQTMVENVSGIQVMLTELLNLILDANLYSSVHAFELDIDQVYDPYEFRDGIFPGKTYKKRGGGNPNSSPMIRDVVLGQMPAQILEVFQALNGEFHQNFGMSPFAMPSGKEKGRVSATEAAKKASASMDFFADMARDQEEMMFEGQVLPMVYDYIIAYQRNMRDPVLTDLMGEEASSQAQLYLNNPKIREYLQYAPVSFKSDGMSRIAQRLQELDKVMAFINLLGNSAKAIPQILQQVNWKELMEMALYALDWDPSKILMQEGAMQPPIPGPENPPKPPAAGGGGGGQQQPAGQVGIPETMQTVPSMASANQAFQGYKGQAVTPELGG